MKKLYHHVFLAQSHPTDHECPHSRKNSPPTTNAPTQPRILPLFQDYNETRNTKVCQTIPTTDTMTHFDIRPICFLNGISAERIVWRVKIGECGFRLVAYLQSVSLVDRIPEFRHLEQSQLRVPQMASLNELSHSLKWRRFSTKKLHPNCKKNTVDGFLWCHPCCARNSVYGT